MVLGTGNEMKTKQLLTPEQKIAYWDDGEWVNEPDFIEFEYEGFDCQVLRTFAFEHTGDMFGGHLCGYVCIPESHPYHGINFFDLKAPDIEVHYGITYNQIRDEKYWIGFDCAHSSDITPSMERYKRQNNILKELPDHFKNLPMFNTTYKNISFAIGECKSIVDQIKDLK